MKDLISSNKEAIDLVISRLDKDIKSFQEQIDFEELMIKELTDSIEDKKRSRELMILETAKLKYCKGLIESSRTKF